MPNTKFSNNPCVTLTSKTVANKTVVSLFLTEYGAAFVNEVYTQQLQIGAHVADLLLVNNTLVIQIATHAILPTIEAIVDMHNDMQDPLFN